MRKYLLAAVLISGLIFTMNLLAKETAWKIEEIHGAAKAGSLSSGRTAGPHPGIEEYSFRPEDVNDVFLRVGFRLKAEKEAEPLDVRDIIFVVNRTHEFYPIGFSTDSYKQGHEWRIGRSFGGTFTSETSLEYTVVVNLPDRFVTLSGNISGDRSWAFAYVVPIEYFTSDSRFELRIAGSQGVVVPYHPSEPESYISSVSSDGKYVVVTQGKSLSLFERYSSTPLWSYTASYPFRSVKISPDGGYILVVAREKRLRWGPHSLLMFHKSSPEPLWEIDFKKYRYGTAVISADGSHVAVAANKEGNGGYYVYLIDTSNGNLIGRLGSDKFIIENIAISTNGKYIAYGHGNELYLFDGFRCSEIWKDDFLSFGHLNAVSISSDGSYVGTTYDIKHLAQDATTYTHRVLMYQRSSSTPIWEYRATISAPGYAYHSCALSADGNSLVAWSDSKLTLFSRDSNTPLWSKDDFPDDIETVAVSSDGACVAVGCGDEDDNTIYLFDRTGNILWKHTGIGNQVDISKDGESIVASSRTSVRLLNKDGVIETIFSFDQQTQAQKPAWDVTQDGIVDLFDLVLVGKNFGEIGDDVVGDVNSDGKVNIFDLVLVGKHFGEKAAPSIHNISLLQQIYDILKTVPNPNDNLKLALKELEKLLAPSETVLLQNYPNPFNPETWLPYQLASDAPVIINIYNTQGQLIRTLHLGTKKAGIYMTKEKAAYWDGKDNFGQSVASGVYFYQMKAGDFSATRKLVILK